MRAIATNILVRLMLRDDPAQAAAVDALVAAGGLFVPLSVVMESEWVMRTAYRLDRAAIADRFEMLPAIEGLEVEQPGGFAWACERYRMGADLADMIHLLACRSATGFATFDRRLAAQAGPDTPVAIETLDA